MGARKAVLQIWSVFRSATALAVLLAISAGAARAGTPPPMPMPMGGDFFDGSELCDFEIGPMSLEDENPDAFCPKFHPGDRTTNKDVGNLVNIISKPISNASGGVSGARMNSNIGGVAAGDFGENIGWWVNYTRTSADDTLAITEYDASLNTVVAGLDTTINDNLVIGVAFIYENHDYDTRMNGGNQDVEGFSGAPYIGWFINDNFSFDATVGYGGFDVEQTRVNSITAVATDLVRGDTDQDRWFVAANLNGFTRVGDFVLSGRVGLLYTELDTDTINEVDLSFAAGDPNDDAFVTPSTSIEIGQVSFGGEVAYSAFALEPYASIYYVNDFERTDIVVSTVTTRVANDDDEVRGALGARWFSNDGFSAFVEATFVGAREDFNSHAISALVRFDF